MIIMQLNGTATGLPTPYDGQWLKSFDFEANDGVGEILMTPLKAEAMQFKDMAEAFAFYRTQPKNHPLRPDGRPNRPLTSTNWEFQTEKGERP